MKLSQSISRLRRQAKQLARAQDIALHQALNAVAQDQGFPQWSLLVAQNPAPSPAEQFLDAVQAGDLALVAGRRHQGKTLFALETIIAAAQAGFWTKIYSFEFTQSALRTQLLTQGATAPIELCCTDAMSAQTIANDLAAAKQPAFVLIDFMQALDHDRDKPALGDQLALLKTAAMEHDAIICLISQIDRGFEDSDRSVPELSDLRLPNPIDTNLFALGAFLNKGSVTIRNFNS